MLALVGVVHNQHPNIALLPNLLQGAECSIVASVDGVVLVASWPDFFENIDDNERGVRVLFEPRRNALFEPFADPRTFPEGFQIVIEQFWLLRNYAISHKHL